MKVILIVFGCIGVAFAVVAKFDKCDGWSDDICDVSEVRINPCKDRNFCVLKRGQQSSIEFDFTPKFNAQNLTSSLFWASPTGDLAFDKFSNVNACEYTTCPTVSGTQQLLSYSLRLDKIIPKGSFTFKWRLWDTEDEEKECCFKTNIKIR